mmetsp:Transcript_62221/g.122954  ORF Transcript_62221/g.122954 Transcript_62221/m.122954 type:complete len:370 (-) Transcript_62221:433-1542(-)
MGNFLDTPVTEKETSVDRDGKVAYGLSAMQGWRAQMEDDHVQLLSLSQELPDFSLFGVFDGHGGDMVAHYAAKHIPRFLLDTGELVPGMPEGDVPRRAQTGFEKAVMALDAELQQLPEMLSGQDQSGSTSVMTLLSKEHIVCANTGDSRAVLSRNGKAVALSYDHKPYNPIEKDRIENAGSHVKFNRVNGDLAVSRALGDFVYKRCESIEPEKQAVTAFPEMMCEIRNAADEFIVLACDGIWDVMSSQEVVDQVRGMLQNGRPPEPLVDPVENLEGLPAVEQPPMPKQPPRQWDLGAVSECLIDLCLRLGSRDNMSVIVVLLDPRLMPKPEVSPSEGTPSTSATGSSATAASSVGLAVAAAMGSSPSSS